MGYHAFINITNILNRIVKDLEIIVFQYQTMSVVIILEIYILSNYLCPNIESEVEDLQDLRLSQL